MQKKKVLILITSYWPMVGGAEVAVEEITKRLTADFDFTVFTARLNKSLSKREVKDGVEIYRLGWGCWLDKYFLPLLVLVKSYSVQFDLVYAVMASYAGISAWLLNRWRGKEYILNMQSGTLGSSRKRLKVGLVKPIYRQVHRRAKRIHAISNSLKERAESLGAAAEKIVVIPNGVDLDRFKKLPMKKNDCQIITVARLEKIKGVEYLIRALPLIIARQSQAKLLIVGDGRERGKLEKLAQELNIAQSVNFVGTASRQRVAELMNVSTVFVCPSLAEGFGIVCIEAMACGLAVVGTNVGGIPDIIRHGENGFLIKSASAGQIADAVIYLLENPQSRERLVAGALATVQQYSWDNISKKVSCLFV